jgi:hypothetical protein
MLIKLVTILSGSCRFNASFSAPLQILELMPTVINCDFIRVECSPSNEFFQNDLKNCFIGCVMNSLLPM